MGTQNGRHVLDYHEASKHSLERYAVGPKTLDWDDQPQAFRWFDGAPKLLLPLTADRLNAQFVDIYPPGTLPPQPLTLANIAALLELSMGLSAWKQYGDTKWALRCNPSSGNLHPTEAYVIIGTPGEIEPGTYHYLSRDHLLEQRCCFTHPVAGLEQGVFVGLSSIHWREAWKYGERAFRYCQLDIGHAIAAIRYATACLGWQVRLQHDWTDAEIATVLGLDRTQDFYQAEREHPDLMLWITCTGDRPPSLTDDLVQMANQGVWRGLANTLSPHHNHDWPRIDQVADAALKPATEDRPAPNPATYPPPLPSPCTLTAAQIIRQRRSAQSFDGKTMISAASFYRMLDMTLPRQSNSPWDTGLHSAGINLILFVHRVEGLAPGVYTLIRDAASAARFRAALGREGFTWNRPADCPPYLPLYQLAQADTQRVAATLACHQDIAAHSSFSLGMLADMSGADLEMRPWHYRHLYWEAGMIGQVLYLEAEAAGVRGTGIGCYFDDAVRMVLGMTDATFQSLYHFTVGAPLNDSRLRTLAPYAHLADRHG